VHGFPDIGFGMPRAGAQSDFVKPPGFAALAIAMKKRFAIATVVIAAFAAFAAVLPARTSAAPLAQALTASLDEPLHCDRPAHEFIGALETRGLIDPHPSHVEANSINAFNPVSRADLTAFGFRVFAIVGYQKDDPLFQKGNGKPLADSAYGAVVVGSTESVEKAVRAGGSSAIVHHVAPLITAIFCQMDESPQVDSR
jgi:hypothetical protein